MKVAFLLMFSALSLCNGALTLDKKDTKIYNTVLRNYHGLGNFSLHSVYRSHLTVKREEDIEKLSCNTSQNLNLREEYFDKVVVLSVSSLSTLRTLCHERARVSRSRFYALAFEIYDELAALNTLCALEPLAVIFEKPMTSKLNVYSISVQIPEVYEMHPFLRQCVTLRTYESRMDVLKNLTRNESVTVQVDEDESVLAYFHPAVYYGLRISTSIPYFIIALLAIKYLYIRIVQNKLTTIHFLVLFLNATTLLILGGVQAAGSYYLYGWLSVAHSILQQMTLLQFFGTSIACDFFTAVLYTSTCDSVKKVQSQNRQIHREYPILFSVGLGLLLLDWTVSWLLTSQAPGVFTWLLLLPSLEVCLQMFVLSFFLRQQYRMLATLKQARSSMGPTSQPSVAGTVALERRMRYWVKISILGSLLSAAALGFFSSDAPLESHQLYLLDTSMFVVGKLLNSLAQVKITQPPPSAKSNKIFNFGSVTKEASSTTKPSVVR